MWSGSLAWTTPVLAPGETYLHIAFVSFTASGVYGVGMSASYLPVEEEGGREGGGGGGMMAAFAKSQRGESVGGGREGGGGGGEPLLYWGHESQVLVITEVEGEDGRKGGRGGGREGGGGEEDGDINDLMGGGS